MPVSVFLSSTLRDLTLERRFVISVLEKASFAVLAVEKLGEKLGEEQALKWSLQQTKSADYTIVLIGESNGSEGDEFLGISLPYVYCEARAASAVGKPVLCYDLNRPFPDSHLLLRENENAETIARGHWEHIFLYAMNLRYQLSPYPMRQINSVKELGETVPRDIASAEAFRWKSRKARNLFLRGLPRSERDLFINQDYLFCDCGTLVGDRGSFFGPSGKCEVCGMDIDKRRGRLERHHERLD